MPQVPRLGGPWRKLYPDYLILPTVDRVSMSVDVRIAGPCLFPRGHFEGPGSLNPRCKRALEVLPMQNHFAKP